MMMITAPGFSPSHIFLYLYGFDFLMDNNAPRYEIYTRSFSYNNEKRGDHFLCIVLLSTATVMLEWNWIYINNMSFQKVAINLD